MLLSMIFMSLFVVGESIRLFNTEDRFLVEFYDCFTYNHIDYCRRPSGPIPMNRDELNGICYNNGTAHTFEDLSLKNISIKTLLHDWNLTLETIEEYANYLTVGGNKTKYLCQCINSRSFGKNCEYLLSRDSLDEVIEFTAQIIFSFSYERIINSDIICYTTLICDYGLLCLDWRDICNGNQQCMFGYDEENCDILEFNECETDEYRCLNGMCIPNESFLDGEYDCLDLSDEMQFFDDLLCFMQVTLTCDDRICPKKTWSCGDGQCISDRFAFQNIHEGTNAYYVLITCKSERDQYFLCETNDLMHQWTLSNGKCINTRNSRAGDIVFDHDKTTPDDCDFFIKCALSLGAAIDCPCRYDGSCYETSENPCNFTDLVQYPKGSIHTPYTFFLYNTTRDWYDSTPDYILINGTIKCRGYSITHILTLPYDTFEFSWDTIESFLCNHLLNNSSDNTDLDFSHGYDRFCHNDTLTFNNQPYNYIDICKYSRECISAYRIRDGYIDCADGLDEHLDNNLIFDSCSHLKYKRLRCSVKDQSCLPITVLGNNKFDCQNTYDEFIKETYTSLLKLICNNQLKRDCTLIRQYIEDSWKFNYDIDMFEQKYLQKIPFYSYCNGFWDMYLHADENILMCQNEWVCHEHMWQCRTGQCINTMWVLDTIWDCSDGSDEQALFFSNSTKLFHNSKLFSIEYLEMQFDLLYSDRPWAKLCDFRNEFPCVRINTSTNIDHLTHDELCISLSKLGDETIDCLGGLDERNTLEQCDHINMLGEYYKCLTSNTCIYMDNICDVRCPNKSDDELMCFGKEKSENCSAPTTDFMCLNNECAKDGWCDGSPDCPYGEDEYMCSGTRKGGRYTSNIKFYRGHKSVKVYPLLNQLSMPRSIDTIHASKIITNSPQISLLTLNLTERDTLLSYACNRGIGVIIYNDSIACFCPPQYYGDKCQFHSDRIVIILQLDMTKTIYEESHDLSIILKLFVIFLFENQTINTYEFHIVPAKEPTLSSKNINYFLYSRSNKSLHYKRMRYFNRSNIIHEHPYAIQINAYELQTNQTPRFIAVWKYSIYFDYLPNFQFAKILRLYNPNSFQNPCLSNPCHPSQECYQILNENLHYICICPNKYRGPDCLRLNSLCSTNFCSSQAICDANYRSNDRPFCICPANLFGHHCGINNNPCSTNPCRNNASCFANERADEYFCVCDAFHTGVLCALKRTTLNFSLRFNIEHKGAIIQHRILQRISEIEPMITQYSYYTLPHSINYNRANLERLQFQYEIITVKLFLNKQFEFYLVYYSNIDKSVNRTVELNNEIRIVNVDTLFKNKNEISPYKYHSLCIKNRNLRFFHDHVYLCMCVNNNTRAECFLHEHDIAECKSCLRNGLCLKQDYQFPNKFICICPRCFNGEICQFSTEGFSLTFDFLIVYNRFAIKLIYSICSFVIFLIGCITNYASFVTFKRPNSRKTSIGNYLFVQSFVSQISLLALLFKINYTLFVPIPIDIPCKITAYILSVTIRYSYWLMSLITIDRLCITLFPFNNTINKSYKTVAILLITLVITSR